MVAFTCIYESTQYNFLHMDYMMLISFSRLLSSKIYFKSVTNQFKTLKRRKEWHISLQIVYWFKTNKKSYTFTVFKLLQSYPSIKRHLLKKAISFPKKACCIPQKRKEINFHSKKISLYPITVVLIIAVRKEKQKKYDFLYFFRDCQPKKVAKLFELLIYANQI